MAEGYRALIVWSKAIDLALTTYAVTEPFPRQELFGLTSQMRRAAVAVPSNIAEGHGRFTPGEFLNSLSNAQGSLNELETQAWIACRLGFFNETVHRDFVEQTGEVGRLITGTKRSQRARKRN